MSKKHNRNIGTVISGTMRPKDLIPAFISKLSSQRPLAPNYKRTIARIEASIQAGELDAVRLNDGNPYWDPDECSYDLKTLFNALEDFAPSYFYFGAHPGDGSDYGYWLSEDWDGEFYTVNDWRCDPTITAIKVSDLSEVPTNYYGEIAVVTDHGNVTLYVRAKNNRLTEVWSIV